MKVYLIIETYHDTLGNESQDIIAVYTDESKANEALIGFKHMSPYTYRIVEKDVDD